MSNKIIAVINRLPTSSKKVIEVNNSLRFEQQKSISFLESSKVIHSERSEEL